MIVRITMKRKDTGEVIASDRMWFGDNARVKGSDTLKPMAMKALLDHQAAMVAEFIEFDIHEVEASNDKDTGRR